MELLPALEASVAYTQKIMENVERNQALLPTPCENWLVFEVLDHMTESIPQFANAAWHDPPPTSYEKPQDAADFWRIEAHRAIEGWSRPGAFEKTVNLSIGPHTARRSAEMMLVETAVHGWDLAKATDQPAEMPEGVAEAARQAVDDLFEHVFKGPREPKMFKAPVPVAEDASPTDQLVAFLGRTP